MRRWITLVQIYSIDPQKKIKFDLNTVPQICLQKYQDEHLERISSVLTVERLDLGTDSLNFMNISTVTARLKEDKYEMAQNYNFAILDFMSVLMQISSILIFFESFFRRS